MTQIIAAVASSQYGGQSVDVRHLGKYLRKSYNKYKNAIRKEFGDSLPEEVEEHIIKMRLRDELKSGVQTIQYQINTLMTTNGQSPFVTLFLNLNPDDEYVEENAMIIEEILRQRDVYKRQCQRLCLLSVKTAAGKMAMVFWTRPWLYRRITG